MSKNAEAILNTLYTNNETLLNGHRAKVTMSSSGRAKTCDACGKTIQSGARRVTHKYFDRKRFYDYHVGCDVNSPLSHVRTHWNVAHACFDEKTRGGTILPGDVLVFPASKTRNMDPTSHPLATCKLRFKSVNDAELFFFGCPIRGIEPK